jgi:hypothetical protein
MQPAFKAPQHGTGIIEATAFEEVPPSPLAGAEQRVGSFEG